MICIEEELCFSCRISAVDESELGLKAKLGGLEGVIKVIILKLKRVVLCKLSTLLCALKNAARQSRNSVGLINVSLFQKHCTQMGIAVALRERKGHKIHMLAARACCNTSALHGSL